MRNKTRISVQCAILTVFLGIFSVVNAQSNAELLALYTTDNNNQSKRVFRVNEVIKLNVVIRNTSSSSALTINQGGLVAQELGNSSGATGVSFRGINSEAHTIPAGARKNITVFLPSDFPEWTREGFRFLGEKVTTTVKLNNIQIGSVEFFVDEFHVPDWITRGNALVLAGLGAGFEVEPYALYKPANRDLYLNQAKACSTKVVFLSAEFFNYGVLEGGLKYNCPACIPPTNSHVEPFNHYWFPTGPEENTFDYTRPPQFSALGSTDDERRLLIKQFVDRAHQLGIKVVVYMDFMGIYDPQLLSVRAWEELNGVTRSFKSKYLNEPAWVRQDVLGQPTRLALLENIFDPLDSDFEGWGWWSPIVSQLPWWIAAITPRRLNPDDYAITPSLFAPGSEGISPYQVSTDVSSAISPI